MLNCSGFCDVYLLGLFDLLGVVVCILYWVKILFVVLWGEWDIGP